MGAELDNINIIELLMGIKEDVASIKTEVASFQKTQEKDREDVNKDINEVKATVSELEQKINDRLDEIDKVQDKIITELDKVKHKDTEKDARKWKTSIAFILTALAGMTIAKIPDFVIFLIEKTITKGQ